MALSLTFPLSSTDPFPLVNQIDARECAAHRAFLLRIRFARLLFSLLLAGFLSLLCYELWFAQHFGWRTSVPMSFEMRNPSRDHQTGRAR